MSCEPDLDRSSEFPLLERAGFYRGLEYYETDDAPWKGPVEKEQNTSVTEDDLERWHRMNTN
jgi:hypothetical protein